MTVSILAWDPDEGTVHAAATSATAPDVLFAGESGALALQGLSDPAARAVARQLVPALDAGLPLQSLGAHLRDRFPEPSMRIIEGDVLQLDLPGLLEEEKRSTLLVVANLPYNITAPVLFRLREHAGLVRRAVLTLQKEVAERLVATPGTKAYSQITVLLGQCARISIARMIPSTAFRPQPKVDSAVIEVEFQPGRIPVDDLRRFQIVVKTAFSQRRKMLRNVLRALPTTDGHGTIANEDLERLAAAADIDLTQRAEDLSIGQFARFASVLGAAGSSV